MKNTPLCCINIAILVLFFLLSMTEAEAQNLAQWTSQYSRELGLTTDQKKEIEAVQKYVENQRQAVFNNVKLDREKRMAKLHEINESERERVNEVLTPDQQRKLKDLMYPKQQWMLNAYINVGLDLSHYTARLEGYPPDYLSYIIHKQDIKLSTLDADGKPVLNGLRLTLAPDVPDVIKPVVDETGSRTCQLDFILDRKTAHPGLYILQFRAAVDATDAETHDSVKLRDAVGSQRVYLTPQPDETPALKLGQRFLGIPYEQASASAATPYRDVKSCEPISWREIATKIATLQQVTPSQDGNRLTFVIEGHTGQIFVDTKYQATDIPYLTPLLSEPMVRGLKAKYEGKQVWCDGGPGAQCVSTEPGMSVSMSGHVDVPLRIRRIERVYMPKVESAIGTSTFIGGERESSFVTDNPLIVILDAPAKGLKFNSLYYVDGEDPQKTSIDVASNPRAYCLGLWNAISDRWDFEREYSLSSPFKLHPEWPAKIRKVVLSGEVVKGMTHEMVAWAIGWPSIYGTKDDMLHIDDWTYDNIPFQGHVYFNKDQVVDQEWPSLP